MASWTFVTALAVGSDVNNRRRAIGMSVELRLALGELYESFQVWMDICGLLHLIAYPPVTKQLPAPGPAEIHFETGI